MQAGGRGWEQEKEVGWGVDLVSLTDSRWGPAPDPIAPPWDNPTVALAEVRHLAVLGLECRVYGEPRYLTEQNVPHPEPYAAWSDPHHLPYDACRRQTARATSVCGTGTALAKCVT